MLNRPHLCILGFGAFGELVARALAPFCDLSVIDPAPEAAARAVERGFTLAALHDLPRADIVVLAMPVPALAPTLRLIAPHLRPGQLVMDVCSIKDEPARIMQDCLPPDVEILASHPMFGPQSTVDGFRGARIVLCPLRGNGWRRIAAFLRRHGLEVIRSTPAEHDRQAALTQGLTHLLAQAFRTLGPQPTIRTKSFDLMMSALAQVSDDAPEVYQAVTAANPHFAEARARLIGAMMA